MRDPANRRDGFESGLNIPADQIQLFQNEPNPFTESTEIRFVLPAKTRDAMLMVYDLQGKPVRKFAVAGSGESSVRVQGGELAEGMYIYSLIVNGKVMDTKRMILTR